MYGLVSQMELAVHSPWMQREDVSDLSQELVLSGTPTLHQRTMGKESGWEFADEVAVRDGGEILGRRFKHDLCDMKISKVWQMGQWPWGWS